ncbi:hypothetical protein PPACK8108_LOCUS18044 [Phakopsora pachyrhizi]|uniref:CCHC-type domain-containing protein n=1 Tax=Phakopsora pachyrhizi TaxID=170000 RepID=A0AAV0BBQ2_PHAPC|nr:hypothetical protein PPACK8108_LOCUS18044 [Phakopsora pachyrhizi]
MVSQTRPTYQSPLDEANQEEPRLQTPGNRRGTRATPERRNLTKIKPMDKRLIFDGTNVEKFIQRYEVAAAVDGAAGEDVVLQVGIFAKDEDIQEEIEEMEGYLQRDCKLLKNEMIDKWGDRDILRRYTKDDLVDLSIRRKFMAEFNTILKYLTRNGYLHHEDEAKDLLLNSLSTDLRRLVSRELAKQGGLVRAKDGGYPTPPLSTLKEFIENEVEAMRVLDSGYGRKNIKAGRETRPREAIRTFGLKTSKVSSTDETEKKLDTLTEAFKRISQKLDQISQPRTQQYQKPAEGKSTMIISPSHVPYRPAQQFSKQLKCYYCFKEGHTVQRCPVSNQDILSGRVAREPQGYVLPDGSLIPYDITRPIAPINEEKTQNNQVNQLEMLEISPELFQKVKEELNQKHKFEEELLVLPGDEEYRSSYGMLESWDPPVISSNHFESSYFLRGVRASKEPNPPEPQTSRIRKEDNVKEQLKEEEYEMSGRMPSSSKKPMNEPTKGPIIRDPAKVQQALEKIEKVRREEFEKVKHARMEEKKKQQQKEEAEKLRKQMEEEDDLESQEIITSNQEEATRRIRPQYQAAQAVLKRIFDTPVSLSVGELTAVSPTIAEEIKKLVSKKKVTEDQSEVNTGGIHQDMPPADLKSSEGGLTYTCPLGFVKAQLGTNGGTVTALVDSGASMNIIPENETVKLGIPVVALHMKLRGIGGHISDIVGVAENTPVFLAGHKRRAHFFIARGAVHVDPVGRLLLKEVSDKVLRIWAKALLTTKIMTNETRKLHHKGLLPFLTLTVTEYDSKGHTKMDYQAYWLRAPLDAGVLQTDLIDCVDLLRKGRLENIKELRLQTDGVKPLRIQEGTTDAAHLPNERIRMLNLEKGSNVLDFSSKPNRGLGRWVHQQMLSSISWDWRRKGWKEELAKLKVKLSKAINGAGEDLGLPIKGMRMDNGGDIVFYNVCLGRPFLVDYDIGLNFSQGKGDMFNFEDEKGKTICFPICKPNTQGWEKDIPEGVQKQKELKTNLGSIMRVNSGLGAGDYRNLKKEYDQESVYIGYISQENSSQEEKPEYLEEEKDSLTINLPGHKLMDEDFGLILPSISGEKFFYNL